MRLFSRILRQNAASLQSGSVMTSLATAPGRSWTALEQSRRRLGRQLKAFVAILGPS